MYCKYCGKQIDSDSNFCRFCGKDQNVTDLKKDITIEEVISEHEPLATDTKVFHSFKEISRYDNDYTKETIAAFVGGLLILINLLYLAIAPNLDIPDRQRYSTFAIINAGWRLIASNWCTKISGRQNRSMLFWGILGFIVPNLALLILGVSRRLSINGSIIFRWKNKDYRIFKVKDSFTFAYGSYEEFYYKNDLGQMNVFFRKKSNNRFFIVDPEPIIFDSLDDCFTYLEKRNN